MKIIISLFAIALSCSAFAGHDHPPVKTSPEFNQMKALLGTWTGKTNMNGKEEPLKVTYEMTSAGTAIVEKMNPGTPMEMMTVYANRGNTVHATHFCSMGNQPEMSLKKSKDKAFTFEMDGMNGLADKNEMHMHAVTLTVDGNKLKEEWTSYQDNKKGGTHTFELTKSL